MIDFVRNAQYYEFIKGYACWWEGRFSGHVRRGDRVGIRVTKRKTRHALHRRWADTIATGSSLKS